MTAVLGLATNNIPAAAAARNGTNAGGRLHPLKLTAKKAETSATIAMRREP
eukprot:CAMPEP_0172722882 /NCGR_PEP_ID=MMETSP1074-20121228/82505_1 /TAXON_ID=2916 /ORGANISM="Ceratium fusus, Strain PA161109" /LENGTH=50 /DNA_ID=CAMNT_0013548987 /DNA_START=115 /DNA_END=264 /DNA_ORIENTATION=+